MTLWSIFYRREMALEMASNLSSSCAKGKTCPALEVYASAKATLGGHVRVSVAQKIKVHILPMKPVLL